MMVCRGSPVREGSQVKHAAAVKSEKRTAIRRNKEAISEKAREALLSVLPLIIAVILLTLTISPVRNDVMISFIFGTVLLVIGMGLFSLGAEQSMSPIGAKVGSALTASRNLPLILIVSFALGVAVTVAEPDLQVLAATVPHINSWVLIITVGVGVGLFLMLSMLRILTGIKLKLLLIIFYVIVFVLAALSDSGNLCISFDAGGVTTGPMTVPFILALGYGVSRIRSDKAAEADSFGLVALASIGPILSVLVLGFFYKSGGGTGTTETAEAVTYSDTADIFKAYLRATPKYMKEMAIALLPVVVIFLLFQVIKLRMSGRDLGKIFIGILYTYIGLVLFLVGVNVGFSALGSVMGTDLAGEKTRYLLIPLAMALGWFIISAEPAVVVLEKQVEEVSAGAIPGKAIKYSMSIGVSLAMGISMLRVLCGISIMWFLVPGYALALLLCFFVPDIYTAIAFDSGGVASGPLTATFMLRLTIGTATSLGRDIFTDAFGVVAMVALMPLISIQLLGLVYGRRKKAQQTTVPEQSFGDFDIIELWEEAS
jgi:hypothetical protein